MNVINTFIFGICINLLTIYPAMYLTNIIVALLHRNLKKAITCVCRLAFYLLLVWLCVIKQRSLQLWINERHVIGIVALVGVARFSIMTLVKMESNKPLKYIYDNILLSPYKTIQYWHRCLCLVFIKAPKCARQMELKLKILLK